MLQALIAELNNRHAEVRHYMAALDFWVAFILSLMILLIAASRFPQLREAVVVAAILGAVGMVWVGRIDVLIHRPVPEIKDLETKIARLVNVEQTAKDKDIKFEAWETHYKANLKTSVKILIPLDAIAGILIFTLFLYANNYAYEEVLQDWTWRGHFWWCAVGVHFLGWAIILFTKKLAE